VEKKRYKIANIKAIPSALIILLLPTLFHFILFFYGRQPYICNQSHENEENQSNGKTLDLHFQLI